MHWRLDEACRRSVEQYGLLQSIADTPPRGGTLGHPPCTGITVGLDSPAPRGWGQATHRAERAGLQASPDRTAGLQAPWRTSA
jgi:hypothetical protein